MAGSLQAGQLTVSWDDNSTTELGFKVERSTNGSTFATIATLSANTRSYVDASVAAATTYWYRVKAYTLLESSAYSNVTSATTPSGTSTSSSSTDTSTSTGTISTSTSATNYSNTTTVIIPGRLQSLTARAVGGSSAAQTLRTLFTVTGATKSGLVRAIGPGLQTFTSAAVMADPRLTVNTGGQLYVSNDNWGGSSAVSTMSNYVGAFPLSSTSTDAAAYRAFAAGTYEQLTVGTGPGLVQTELYDADSTQVPAGRFSRVSVRAPVGTGTGVLTSAFAIAGNTSLRVLIRAIGPSLTGVTGVLADPILTLYKGTTVVATNDNWAGSSTLSSAFTKVGASSLATTSKDAALLVTLSPGVYSLTLTGAASTVGIAQLELFEETATKAVARINAGGSGATSTTGPAWTADAGFNSGVAYSYPETTIVTGTADPAAFLTERYQPLAGTPLVYTLPVPNGNYVVRLHFAESSAPLQAVGKRVFDVDIQSVRAFEDVDIFVRAGGANRALVLQKTATVTNGQLSVRFLPQVQNPKVNAIEVIAVP